ncbi:hypothetical protein [Paraburkholderia tropica]|uniref:hypothetical protein n=1 Tax=Paraburkholderia tropica TaxID=92647 RepID=UPI001FC8DCEB|nr:hypothetical protein [Paraburkholderia tropica]
MELLNSKAAAEWLDAALPGESAGYWQRWLTNNRNQTRRVPYRIPFQSVVGFKAAHYDANELARFVEFEKQRRLGSVTLTGRAAEVMRAYGIGEKGGSTTGRKLKVSGIHPQVDEAGKPYVQLITDDPLMVYRIEVADAVAVLKELSAAVDVCKRAAA